MSSHATFRLSHIPASADHGQLISGLTAALGPDCEIIRANLSPSPIDNQTQVGGVIFAAPPAKLKSCWDSKLIEVLPVELDGTVHDIEFDCNFIGLMPLSCSAILPDTSTTPLESSTSDTDIDILYIPPISTSTTIAAIPQWLTRLPPSVPRARILTYGHLRIDASSPNTVALANALLECIKRTRIGQGPETHRQLFWITTGNGGLVAKYALLQAAQSQDPSPEHEIYKDTHRLLLIHSPRLMPWGLGMPEEQDLSGEVPAEAVHATLKEWMEKTERWTDAIHTAGEILETETWTKKETKSEQFIDTELEEEDGAWVVVPSLPPPPSVTEKSTDAAQNKICHQVLECPIVTTSIGGDTSTIPKGHREGDASILEYINSAVSSIPAPPTLKWKNRMFSNIQKCTGYKRLRSIGTVKVLERLHTLLTDPATVQLTLYGRKGIGKTYLVGEYIRLHRDMFTMCFWVSGQSTYSLRKGFHRLAQKIVRYTAGRDMGDIDYLEVARLAGMEGLVDSEGEVMSYETEDMVVVDAVKRWLERWRGGRWILVLDSIKDGVDIEPYLPETEGKGVVVVTEKSYRGMGVGVDVEAIFADAPVRFLLGGREAVGVEVQEVQTLSETLKHIPLAHNLAAAYMSIHNTTTSRYKTLFSTMRNRLKSTIPEFNKRDQISVTAFEINFQTLQEIHPKAAGLFTLCTFLDRSNLAEELLIAGYRLLNNVDESDETILSTVIAPLITYSLVKRSTTLNTLETDDVPRRYHKGRLSRPGRHYHARHALTLISASPFTLARHHLSKFNPTISNPLGSYPPDTSTLLCRRRIAQLYQQDKCTDQAVEVLRFIMRQAVGVLPPYDVAEIMEELCSLAIQYGDREFPKAARVLIKTIKHGIDLLGETAATTMKATSILHNIYEVRIAPCGSEKLLLGLGKYITRRDLLWKVLREYILLGEADDGDAVVVAERLSSDPSMNEVARSCTTQANQLDADATYSKLLKSCQVHLGDSHKHTLAVKKVLEQLRNNRSGCDEGGDLLREEVQDGAADNAMDGAPEKEILTSEGTE